MDSGPLSCPLADPIIKPAANRDFGRGRYEDDDDDADSLLTARSNLCASGGDAMAKTMAERWRLKEASN